MLLTILGLISLILIIILIRYSFYIWSLPPRTIKSQDTRYLPQDYMKNIPKEILEKLDWKNFKHYWYPISLSENLTKDKPYGTKIFDEPIVLYRDKNGVAVCAQDRCEHRMAQLSGGLMIDGEVECPYHGWRFGKEGNCTRVPSAPKDGKVHLNIKLSTKPCEETMGLVWIWIGPPELAHSSVIPRFVLRENIFEGWYFLSHEPEFPFSFDLAVDNVLDAAHFDFTHDGYLGRKESATHIIYEEDKDDPITIIPGSSSCIVKKPEQKHFSNPSDLFGTKFKIVQQKFIFVPPCFVRIDAKFEGDVELDLLFIATPISKNKVKFFNIFSSTMLPRFVQELFKTSLGKWFNNRRNLTILNQDRDMILKLVENLNLKSRVYKRILSSDLSIKKFRDWHKEAMKKNPWFKGYDDIEDLIE